MNLKQLFKPMVKSQSVDEKVKLLISKLNKVTDEYHYKIYLILKSILVLRQSQMDKYTLLSLSNEKNINMTKPSIEYAFGFEHMSDKSKELIQTGKLKASTLLWILRRSYKFRDWKIQDIIIKDYLDGNITAGEICYLPVNTILNKKRIYKKDSIKVGQGIVDKLMNIKAVIIANKKVLLNQRINNRIKSMYKSLGKEIKDLK